MADAWSVLQPVLLQQALLQSHNLPPLLPMLFLRNIHMMAVLGAKSPWHHVPYTTDAILVQ